jgi:hypothetical protein
MNVRFPPGPALKASEWQFDLLAVLARLLASLGPGDATSDVARRFTDGARDVWDLTAFIADTGSSNKPCSRAVHRGPQSIEVALETVTYEEMGWRMGLEPTTAGITIRDSTVELPPPLKPCARCWRARQDSNLLPPA